MSIQKGEWKKADEKGVFVDASLLNEMYFNTGDACLWQVTDFLRVKEPDGTDIELGNGSAPYAVNVPGQVVWYVVLSKNMAQGTNGRENLAVRYSDLRDSQEYHRVKNGAPDPKPVVYRGGDAPMPQTYETANEHVRREVAGASAQMALESTVAKETRTIPNRRGATRVPPFSQPEETGDAPKPRHITLEG